MELLHLGRAIHFILPFNNTTKTTRFSPFHSQTLSPNDPNFPAWWEEHKSEWEEPKKEGQEPADD